MSSHGFPFSLRAVEADMVSAYSSPLTTHLVREWQDIHRRFSLSDWSPSELSGGRFSEVVLRICQLSCKATHTPIGTSLPTLDKVMDELAQVPSSKADDSFRLHIPRSLRVIYDLRNKRDVAHLGKSVSPNFTDSTLILSIANWVMAELVRLSHKCSVDIAQRLIDMLVERRVPLIYEHDDVVRILRPEMSTADKVLVILYHYQHKDIEDKAIAKAMLYGNLSRLRSSILRPLHQKALIHYSGGQARILPPGLQAVEARGLHRA